MGHTASFSTCTFWQQEMELDYVVVSLLKLETCGDTVAQKKSGFGQRWRNTVKVKASPHSDSREHNVENLAFNVIGLGQGEKVSLILDDRELAKVTFGCLPGNA